ncbi:MAG TPA: hypothetical protein VML58_17190 [Burkholderiaceae bacterium]|nr:hypothetical protein [Burkholderiaceae bacterium]
MGHAALRGDAGTPGSGELEGTLHCVERHLDDLQAALSTHDMRCIELHAAELQKALSHAVERFAAAARRGGASLPLRLRLGLASARVTAQRDALARASAALDRAIDVLMPGQAATALYSQSGVQQPRRHSASLEV